MISRRPSGHPLSAYPSLERLLGPAGRNPGRFADAELRQHAQEIAPLFVRLLVSPAQAVELLVFLPGRHGEAIGRLIGKERWNLLPGTLDQSITNEPALSGSTRRPERRERGVSVDAVEVPHSECVGLLSRHDSGYMLGDHLPEQGRRLSEGSLHIEPRTEAGSIGSLTSAVHDTTLELKPIASPRERKDPGPTRLEWSVMVDECSHQPDLVKADRKPVELGFQRMREIEAMKPAALVVPVAHPPILPEPAFDCGLNFLDVSTGSSFQTEGASTVNSTLSPASSG